MIFIGMFVLSMSRLSLILWLYDRVEPTKMLGKILLQGGPAGAFERKPTVLNPVAPS
jgi:hypothetical protein